MISSVNFFRACDVSTTMLATRNTGMNETGALLLRSFNILLWYGIKLYHITAIYHFLAYKNGNFVWFSLQLLLYCTDLS